MSKDGSGRAVKMEVAKSCRGGGGRRWVYDSRFLCSLLSLAAANDAAGLAALRSDAPSGSLCKSAEEDRKQ